MHQAYPTNPLPNQRQQQSLPNDTAILVLGIISVVICGVGLITGIITLALSGKSKQLYKANPDWYSQASYNNVNAGRICAIVGVCLSGLVIVFYVFYFIFLATVIGTAVSSEAFQGLN